MIAQCIKCKIIPENYIALSCDHNFCLMCLAESYCNPQICQRVDATGEAVLYCEICSKMTNLDVNSILAIEDFLRSSSPEKNAHIKDVSDDLAVNRSEGRSSISYSCSQNLPINLIIKEEEENDTEANAGIFDVNPDQSSLSQIQVDNQHSPLQFNSYANDISCTTNNAPGLGAGQE